MAERRSSPAGRPGDTRRGLAQLAHAPTGGLATQHDGRSVGELLRDADQLARTLLLDLDAGAAAAMVRSWPTLVDAAAAAWHAVDTVATPPSSTIAARAEQPPPIDDTDVMARLQAVTGGIAGTLATARWPGPGTRAPIVDEIAGHLHRVAALLERHGADLPLHRPDVRADIAAAQMRTMHTVYLAAHATTSSLQQHGRRLHDNPDDDRKPVPLASTGPPYAVGPTGRWVHRIGVCEGIAGRFVRQTHGGLAAALAGEIVPTLEEPDRLQRVLARWDIQVHRTLVADPSPRNLVLASRTQAFIAATTMPILDALDHAGRTGGEPRTPAPLLAAVEVTATAWNRLANRWSDLVQPQSRSQPELAQAAALVRAAARELTHTPSGRAAPDLIATRVDLSRTAMILESALAVGIDVAHLVWEIARHPDLTGPARSLSIRAHNETEAANDLRPRGEPEQDVLWVTPQDVMVNKQIPLPRPVAEGLVLASDEVRRSAVRAASSAEAHDFGDAMGRDDVPRKRLDRSRTNPVEPGDSPGSRRRR